MLMIACTVPLGRSTAKTIPSPVCATGKTTPPPPPESQNRPPHACASGTADARATTTFAPTIHLCMRAPLSSARANPPIDVIFAAISVISDPPLRSPTIELGHSRQGPISSLGVRREASSRRQPLLRARPRDRRERDPSGATSAEAPRHARARSRRRAHLPNAARHLRSRRREGEARGG